MKQVLVILLNDDFSNPDVMDQVNSINARTKLCRDLSMVKAYGGKILEGTTRIYTAKKYVDDIAEVYSAVENVEIKAVIDLEAEKSVEDYEVEDFNAMKKAQLDMLCKDRVDLFGEIKHSMLSKTKLVSAMVSALSGSDSEED